MPRKSSRSGNESRPTRRNLSRRVDGLGLEGGVEDLPRLTLVEALSYDLEPVVPERGVFRLDGEVRRCEPGTELHEIVQNSVSEPAGDPA